MGTSRERDRDGRDRSADVDAHGNPLCGAKRTRHGGEPCKHPAGWGTDHVGIGNCKLHGGSTGSHVRAAQKVVAQAAVVTFGLPREIDPAEALLEEVHRTAGHVAWLGAQLAGLEASRLPGSEWTPLYQAERGHLVRVAKAAVEAGVAERTVRLAERQGQLLVDVIRGVLGDLGLGKDPRVGDVVRRRLAAVVDARTEIA